MHLFSHTIWIAHTPDEVFDFFVDFSKAPLWRSYVRSMAPIDSGPVRAGSRILVKVDLMGDVDTFELTVLACERPSLWRHQTNEIDFKGTIEYRFEPEGAGTRVPMSASANPVTTYGWLAVPLMLLNRRKSYAEQLPQLKRAMEASRAWQSIRPDRDGEKLPDGVATVDRWARIRAARTAPGELP